MNLQLTRPIIFFDLETTGLNIITDHIVEFAYIKVYPDGKEESNVIRINPEMPIPPQSTAVHHITDADVASCPVFKQVAPQIIEIFENCDVAGYNSNHFDVPMLVEQLSQAGFDFEPHKRKYIDVQTIFHKLEQRNLSAAYRFYCNRELTDAHSANADTQATYEVLKAQLERYPQLQNNVDYLSDFSSQNNKVDLAGKIIRDEQGQERFAFGKHKDKLVEEVFEQEPSYYAWMMNGQFAADTKNVITEIYNRVREKRRQPKPPTQASLNSLFDKFNNR
ncbi:MAG: 3'-5' exonuclease [Paludibacteraceae bacterium]|nr:3'-5' exonuclease [Paludibacteraceae bacterium]